METADINVSEQSAAEEQFSALCFEEHITTGVHDGKISLSGFSLNAVQGETRGCHGHKHKV